MSQSRDVSPDVIETVRRLLSPAVNISLPVVAARSWFGSSDTGLASQSRGHLTRVGSCVKTGASIPEASVSETLGSGICWLPKARCLDRGQPQAHTFRASSEPTLLSCVSAGTSLWLPQIHLFHLGGRGVRPRLGPEGTVFCILWARMEGMLSVERTMS